MGPQQASAARDVHRNMHQCDISGDLGTDGVGADAFPLLRQLDASIESRGLLLTHCQL